MSSKIIFQLILVSLVTATVGCNRFGPLPATPEKPKLTTTQEVIQAATEEEADVPVQGAPLSEIAQLHKLSMALRGVSPTAEEYQALRDALTADKAQDFLAYKTKEYLQTAAFNERMVLKLDELFYLKNTSVRPNLVPGQMVRDTDSPLQYSATDNLFRDIFSKNLSWDTLLVGKSYRVPFFKEQSKEIEFYNGALDAPVAISNIFTFFPATEPDSYKEIQFDAKDPRIAGVITSPRFFSRYSATSLNKNRRRAAAIFRAFLCDPMVSAIPENHDSKSLSDLVFPEGETVTEEQIVTSTETLHGTQADCMACHYKLDPMGLTLRESTMSINDQPSPGALVFKNSKNEIINKPGAGVGEVAKFITEQPDYVSCQIETFWNWFIGSDVPLSKKTRTQIADSFNSMDRRAGDFVAYLVSRPEFKIRYSKDPQRMMVVEAKNLLKRCDSCHDGVKLKENIELPRFAAWPVGGDSTKAANWIQKISKSLDLEHQGRNRTMPTANGFKPTTDELTNLQKWISQGAPNERGEKMVNP